MSAYLYRARDEAGDLLYIGITTQPRMRMSTHAFSAPWRHLSRPELEWVEFPDISAARVAEREEIVRHRPPYNTAGNPDKEWSNKDAVRFNFFIDRAQLKALKGEALERDVSVADLVREALDSREKT